MAACLCHVEHHWYTPCGVCGPAWRHAPRGALRAPCPVHGGSNPTALGIAQGRDREGNPMTLLHCFAQDCPIEDICAAMGIEVKDLFCDPSRPMPVSTGMPHVPEVHASSVCVRCRNPHPDEIAQVMLEEMIVSDPQWIQTVRQPGPRCGSWRRRHHEGHGRSSPVALRKQDLTRNCFGIPLASNLPQS